MTDIAPCSEREEGGLCFLLDPLRVLLLYTEFPFSYKFRRSPMISQATASKRNKRFLFSV